jgi:cytochrome c oxidase cbb3-type subunit 3
MQKRRWLSQGFPLLFALTAQAQVPASQSATSPAASRRPQTVVPQSYAPQQVQRGRVRFGAQCGFCHGRDAFGGEGGADLTRSSLVAEDARGDKLGPFLRAGRPDRGMPAFSLSDGDLVDVVAFIHEQKKQAETLGGGRRGVEVEDLQTGNAERGREYFHGAGGCSSCHSPSGDLKDIGSRIQGLALLRRMLYPAGRPAPASPTASASSPSGELIAGQRAHFTLLSRYTDGDMHDVFAYLQTLR